MFRHIRIKLIFCIFLFVLHTMHLKRRNSWPPDVSGLDALNDYTWQRHLAEKNRKPFFANTPFKVSRLPL